MATLVGCTSKENDSSPKEDNIKITVGATPVPAAEILEVAKPLLKEKGYDLEIMEFTDYVIPNISLNEKELDANLFQHTPYMETFNEEKGTDLIAVEKIYLPPTGVYSNKIKDLKNLQEGAVIAVPNDPTNEKRALKLLEKAGVIKVKDGEILTSLDIMENKKNIVIKELDAPQLPRVLDEVDVAVITASFAMEANLNPNEDSIFLEDKSSPYSNILSIRREDKDKPFVQALAEALTSPEVKKFIEEEYNGSILPSF